MVADVNLKKVRVGVIGFGHLGNWHAKKIDLLENATLSSIVDIHPEQRVQAKAIWPNTTVASNLEEVLSRIDAAIISTPTSTHFKYISKLINAQKHILCEKSLVASKEELNALGLLQQKVEEKHLIFQSGLSERFHPGIDFLKEHPKFLAENVCVTINRLAPFNERARDVDVVTDLMIHDIDLLYYLFKQIPYKVMAFGHKIQSDSFDEVTAILFYPEGQKAVLKAHRNFNKCVRSIEINNDEQTLCVDTVTNELFICSSGNIEKISLSRKDHLMIEHLNFCKSIILREDPVINLHEGILASKVAFDVLDEL